MKIPERIRLFQRFDGELQKACRALNVSVVRRILFVNQGDLSFDFFVDVVQQVVFLLFQCFDDLIDVVDDLRAKAFAVFLPIEINQCIVIISREEDLLRFVRERISAELRSQRHIWLSRTNSAVD